MSAECNEIVKDSLELDSQGVVLNSEFKGPRVPVISKERRVRFVVPRSGTLTESGEEMSRGNARVAEDVVLLRRQEVVGVQSGASSESAKVLALAMRSEGPVGGSEKEDIVTTKGQRTQEIKGDRMKTSMKGDNGDMEGSKNVDRTDADKGTSTPSCNL